MPSVRIQLLGIVQGVGFRPYIHRLATEYGLRGTVANKGSLVEIVAQGETTKLDAFAADIQPRAPERSLILQQLVEPCDAPPFADFSIVESAKEEGAIFVSPDIATCPLCEKELFDPSNRRYLHPFINCTACGPRLSIVDAMPYDRERTSMKVFPMCPTCAYEYTHAETRRFDAQPVCCNDCGPRLSFTKDGQCVHDLDAIRAARAALSRGEILAVKGLGGFHLACDATSDAALQRLRTRKQRPRKPFAVMLRDLATAEATVFLENEAARALLTGWQKPILLLPKRPGTALSDLVAPGTPLLGIMLPYTPIHHLLFALPDCGDSGDSGDSGNTGDMPKALVMTSGNISGAPICHTDELVAKELASICDCVLTHNRDITLRCDDSVVLATQATPMVLRRSRGYAPLPILLNTAPKTCVLGIGGELKNTFCLATNGLFYLSPHIGDLADVRTIQALRDSLTRLENLLECSPTCVAADPHPAYNSRALAQELGLPVVYVQHHHAHILSCMAENEVLEPVIGIAFDGTGYGTDGTIWGGEILLATPHEATRLASIAPFPHTGGDIASREGWRIAISMLSQSYDTATVVHVAQELDLAEQSAATAQDLLTRRRINTVQSTSCGRLFDAVAAVLGLCRIQDFEGEAACALQFAAERALARENDPLPTATDLVRGHLPTDVLFRDLVSAARTTKSTEGREDLALSFHRRLAEMVLKAASAARAQHGISRVALSGGVFQNSLLTRLCTDALAANYFTVLCHSHVPANDGGLALGQALFATYAVQR